MLVDDRVAGRHLQRVERRFADRRPARVRPVFGIAVAVAGALAALEVLIHPGPGEFDEARYRFHLVLGRDSA